MFGYGLTADDGLRDVILVPSLMVTAVRNLSDGPQEQDYKRDPQRKALLKYGHMSKKVTHKLLEDSLERDSITAAFFMFGILRYFLYRCKRITIEEAFSCLPALWHRAVDFRAVGCER